MAAVRSPALRFSPEAALKDRFKYLLGFLSEEDAKKPAAKFERRDAQYWRGEALTDIAPDEYGWMVDQILQALVALVAWSCAYYSPWRAGLLVKQIHSVWALPWLTRTSKIDCLEPKGETYTLEATHTFIDTLFASHPDIQCVMYLVIGKAHWHRKKIKEAANAMQHVFLVIQHKSKGTVFVDSEGDSGSDSDYVPWPQKVRAVRRLGQQAKFATGFCVAINTLMIKVGFKENSMCGRFAIAALASLVQLPPDEIIDMAYGVPNSHAYFNAVHGGLYDLVVTDVGNFLERAAVPQMLAAKEKGALAFRVVRARDEVTVEVEEIYDVKPDDPGYRLCVILTKRKKHARLGEGYKVVSACNVLHTHIHTHTHAHTHTHTYTHTHTHRMLTSDVYLTDSSAWEYDLSPIPF